MAVQLQRKLFTVDEYHQMIQGGVFGEDDRLQLIEGEIVEMSPIGPYHAGHVKRLNKFFSRELGDRALIGVQDPITLGPHSEPQPDLVLLRPREDDYTRSHPEAADVLLIVEVADTSAELDRRVKIPLYGRAGIPETWLLPLEEGWLEAYRDPSPVGYRTIRRFLPGEQVSPLAFEDLILEVGEILG